jgi:hypothetical protein
MPRALWLIKTCSEIWLDVLLYTPTPRSYVILDGRRHTCATCDIGEFFCRIAIRYSIAFVFDTNKNINFIISEATGLSYYHHFGVNLSQKIKKNGSC